MRRLVLLNAARTDLASITIHIARTSGSRAIGRRFANMLLGQCEKLASLPGTLGRPRTELRPEMRSFAIRGYLIFFRYGEGLLEVVNILEGHRDVAAHFGDQTQ